MPLGHVDIGTRAAIVIGTGTTLLGRVGYRTRERIPPRGAGSPDWSRQQQG